MVEGVPMAAQPIPMTEDKQLMHQIETAIPHTADQHKIDLQLEMNFNYR